MIPHLFHQIIYLFFFQQNYCTPLKCGELSEYTDSAHTEVEDLSSRCMNASNEYDRCGHDTRRLHPSCTACRRTANLPGPASQNERERNVLFNDALNTFYLRLYSVRHMVKDHSDSEKRNPLLLSINSKGSFICTIPQTG